MTRDEKFEKWWRDYTKGVFAPEGKPAARAAWNARLSDEDLNGGDQLDAIRAEYRYRSDGDALAVERLLAHIDDLKAHADTMAAALEAERDFRKEAEAVLDGEMGIDWADDFGPLYDDMRAADMANDAALAAYRKGLEGNE